MSQICNGIECIKHIDINRLMNATTKPKSYEYIYHENRKYHKDVQRFIIRNIISCL